MTNVKLNITYDAFLDVQVTLPYGVAWSDVYDWYIKWETLSLIMKDGTIHQIDLEPSLNDDYIIETKRPSHVTVTDTSGEVLDEG